jgi:Cu(I)/Ag(I) efflux system protein CusF
VKKGNTAMKKMIAVATALSMSVVLASGVLAQQSAVDGTVEKIDKDGGKVTLKHGPIKNLDMDSMTMVFRVKEPTMLNNLKVGQKVKFEADRVNGQITVTKITGGK